MSSPTAVAPSALPTRPRTGLPALRPAGGGSGANYLNAPFWVVATWQGGSSTGYIASNTATTITLDWDATTQSYWTNGPPPSNATYVITNDAPWGGGDPTFIKQLGSSLGLDYFNGKFWAAWANESDDSPTNPLNPDYFPDGNPNHNLGDPQHTTNIYAIPITVTITGGSLPNSVRGASATDGSAPALGLTPAAPATTVPLLPRSRAMSVGASSAGADAVDRVLASLLTYLPSGADPATLVPLPPRSPALLAGASSAGAADVGQVFALLRSAARPSANHSAVSGSAAESEVPLDPVGEFGDARTDFWFE